MMVPEICRNPTPVQARQRLVEIALTCAAEDVQEARGLLNANYVRQRAGFRAPSKGSWCAAGLTAAMEDAGLLVPAPGTPARRGAIALLDFVYEHDSPEAWTGGIGWKSPGEIRQHLDDAQPGDIIAWLQHPPPDPAGWRRGHVAVIVATASESITTVGWNEGNAPGRVMMRRLWRDPDRPCAMCSGSGRHHVKTSYGDHVAWTECRKTEPRSSTVLWRRPGGLYGIARPVAA